MPTRSGANIIRAGPAAWRVRGSPGLGVRRYRPLVGGRRVGRDHDQPLRHPGPRVGCGRPGTRGCAPAGSRRSPSDSSARTTLLVRKFIPCSPAHCADRSDAAAVPEPVGQARRVRLHPVGPLLDPLLARNGDAGSPRDEPQQPRHPLVAEVLDVGGVRVERVLDVVPVHRRPDADAGVEPAAGQHVDGRQVLGQPQRVLPAERGHRRAELDPARPLRGGREHGDRRGDPVLQVPVPQPRAVEAELLAQLDDLQRRLVPRPPGRRRRTGRWSGSRASPAASRRRHPATVRSAGRRTYDRTIVSGIPAAVVPVVLLAALLHATWNLMAHAVPDRLDRVRADRRRLPDRGRGDGRGDTATGRRVLGLPQRVGAAARPLQPAADAFVHARRLRAGLPAGPGTAVAVVAVLATVAVGEAMAAGPAGRRCPCLRRPGRARRAARPTAHAELPAVGPARHRRDDRRLHDRDGRPCVWRGQRARLHRLAVPPAGRGAADPRVCPPRRGLPRRARPYLLAGLAGGVTRWPVRAGVVGADPARRWPRSPRCGRPAA